MESWSLVGRVVVAGLLGAWAVSFAVHFYLALRWPQMLGDGQYLMLFCVTLPAGWLLGSVLGVALDHWGAHAQPRGARQH